jgi:16S rRNA processing protein RimM
VSSAPGSDLIAVGRIGPAHGNQGEVVVDPLTDEPELRFAAGAVLQTDPVEIGPLEVASWRLHNGKLLVHFLGCENRDAAVALRATQLLIDSASRPPLDGPDDFYDTDLVGLRAVTVAGDELGAVTAVVHIGAADYLNIRIAETDRLVPFVRLMVPEVDLAGGRVLIDPPDGLFDV